MVASVLCEETGRVLRSCVVDGVGCRSLLSRYLLAKN